MLSKTAMALVPAASLVGAAALAPTTSLAVGREPRLHRWQLSPLPGHARDSKCRPLSRPGAQLKLASHFCGPLQKKLNRAG